MKARQLQKMGFPGGDLSKQAKWSASAARAAGLTAAEVRKALEAILLAPQDYRDDPHFGALATALDRQRQAEAERQPGERIEPRKAPAPWRQWGENLDANALQQMETAARLPVTVCGALMPDAHVGYGLPIGGVLATDNAVIPYAVGVDIACRMKLTVLDLPLDTLVRNQDWLRDAIESETRFGVGSSFERRRRREHPVLAEDWSVSPITRMNYDKAHAQLGTSGSGNHFVEFGRFTLDKPDLGLEAGTYVALLSHSGSRGVGAAVSDHYSRLAMQLHPTLPRDLRYLAWLSLDSHEGQEYWAAMELVGKYASANHALIHHHILQHLKAHAVAEVENHHNFAWKERHEIDGACREVIVHRKGATPAGAGVLGMIPGSMASPGFVVRGRGEPTSLCSAAHGAGRVMSRRQARESYRWNAVRKHLQDRGVTVLSAGLDEVPFVYKDIYQVMAAQQDLVEIVARFDPVLVKMAPEGERPED